MLLAGSVSAQIALEVKTVDLSANGKSMKARFVGASQPAGTTDIRMTFSTRTCEKHDLGATIEFEGTNYNFEHLIFDNQLNFKKLEQESVLGMGKALAIAPVLGRNVEINEPYGYVQGASREGTWLNQHRYYPKIYASAGTSAVGSGCIERLEAKKTDIGISFKGEGFLYHNPRPDGVATICYTSAPGTESVTVLPRLYGHDGVKKKETSFGVPYKNFAARFVKLQKQDGSYDYIMVLQPTSGWNKYGIKVAETKTNPLEFEYFRIDGQTMELKDRFTFTAVNTQWLLEHAIEHNGAIYLFGQSSDKVELTGYGYGPFPVSEGGNFQNSVRIDELENYQIMKVQSGKMAHIKVITPDDIEKIQKNIPGTKGSNNPSGYFRLQEIKFTNDQILITGQNTSPGKEGDDRKQEFIMAIGLDGSLKHVYYLPKKNYTDSRMFFTADGKTMYWAIFDYSEFTVTATRKEPTQIKIGFVMGGDDHTIKDRKRNDDGPQLQLVKIDLASFTPSALQVCGEDEYTLFDDCPVLFNNDKEVVFLGVAGKKNDRVGKFIKMKLL